MVGGVRRRGPPLLTIEGGANWLREKVAARAAFAAGKLGTSELEAILFYVYTRRNKSDVPLYMPSIFQHITVNAGLFPATPAAVDDWCEHMITQVLPALDAVVEWNPSMPVEECDLLNATAPRSVRFPLRAFEPYYVSAAARWSLVAPDNVAVVSPFAPSIAHQWTRIETVWSSDQIWSSLKPKLHTIRAGYAPALAPHDDAAWSADVRAGGWRAAVASVVESVAASGARLALIGCGALSLPIVAELKARGVGAIHTGGATQILFGVKGRRWATHDVISRFFNDAWVFPAHEEVPDEARAVEGACYW